MDTATSAFDQTVQLEYEIYDLMYDAERDWLIRLNSGSGDRVGGILDIWDVSDITSAD